MCQRAVVMCVLILLKANDHLIQSAAAFDVKDSNEAFINLTGNDSSTIPTSSRNTTIMVMISDTKNSSLTPMGTILILMGVTTVLTVTVAYTLVVYTTEKRLFAERQIAMRLIPVD
ncbi:unnamed protein product [Litomosoides sigmodontis]|uniref:Nematode cuticle collagen N-terminal domain-containing protein n=1 Tax=Litomosoides sigmodontis TaxID=42156 RepID=A0A3P6TW83_LITSI|nr:unnamed protein product [Litomosoides sigmodontis]